MTPWKEVWVVPCWRYMLEEGPARIASESQNMARRAIDVEPCRPEEQTCWVGEKCPIPKSKRKPIRIWPPERR